MGDLQQDSKNNNYDKELVVAVLKFRRRNGYKSNFIVGPQQINRINIPIDKYLKTIVVNMEWNNGNVRQKPGEKNALGLVKFVLPNTYDIYLHDTPYKTNFDFDLPLLSHGCITMQKARELVLLILKNNSNWSPEKIDQAMNGGKEITHVLKKKIPIHIGYFMAWVNDADEINLYFDIYPKDNSLADLLFNDDSE